MPAAPSHRLRTASYFCRITRALARTAFTTWQGVAPTMSGWLAKKAAWPTAVPEKTFQLVIGADTQVEVKVQHGGAQEGREAVHIVTPTATGHGRALIAADVAMHVVPPCAPYTHPSQEPNDNSLNARSKRMARVELVGGDELSLLNVWALTYIFFTLWPDQEYFVLQTRSAPSSDAWVVPMLASGLAVPHPADTQARKTPVDTDASGEVLVSRAAFWQGAGPLPAGGWVPVLDSDATYPHLAQSHRAAPSGLAVGTLHPARVPKLGLWNVQHATLPLYRRYIPELGQTLTFRLASSLSDTDVGLLHRWHATDRVNTGWRQDMPREEHRKYLAEQEASSDSIALIGEWDGQPFGYVEIYHAKENALRNYFDAGDYDRGFHALVGEEKFRGPHRVRSWMGSLIHLLFLLDPRTMRVVSEPRASNTKMVEYECMCGGHVEKLIDLPHKRAALVFIPRERFFQLCPVGPLPTV